jgi:tRNA A-37 threonylcarbamoyl transferase component Bud32
VPAWREMTQTTTDRADEIIRWAQAALDARRPWKEVLERLETISQDGLPDRDRAHLLLARGVAQHRRGAVRLALNDLMDARTLFAALGDRQGLADTSRELGVVHAWRGAGREAGFAFVRALAEAMMDSSKDRSVRALIEAARANLEIGRPQEAAALLQLALDGPSGLAPADRGRAEVMLIKALNDAGNHDSAHERLRVLDVASLRPREDFLARIELVRVCLRRDDLDGASRLLTVLENALPEDPNAYEHAEYLAIACESRLAAGDAAGTLAGLEKLIPRVEGDDLGAPIVAALGMKARALDMLGRQDEATEAAAGALRRAAARQLQREADALRESLVLRGEAAQALSGIAKGRVEGRFVRSAFVAEGGFGKVVRGFDLETGEEVALKQIRLSKITDRELRQQMFESAEREIEAAKSIAHAGVARVIGLFRELDGDVFVASAYVSGRTLRKSMTKESGRLDWATVLAQLADALAEIHKRGIVHGDVKPENVILSDEVEGRPVLVDFGCATLGRQHRRFGAATFTPAYAAPEQKRFGRVGPTADVFALGYIAFELICGERRPPAAAYPMGLGFVERIKIKRVLNAHGADEACAGLIARAISPWPFLRPSADAFARVMSNIRQAR